MKLYLVEYTTGSTVKNMIVRAKNHIEAETQVKVSVIANIYDDNFQENTIGKVYFNVKDIFGNNHKEVEIIRVYENTASIRDVSTGLTWIVRKRELGLEETNPNNKYPGHFDYRKTKRQWKGKEQQLVDMVRSYN